MLYTRKGDAGTTKLFNSPPGERITKSAPIFEALGTLDELNSNLGYAKVLGQKGECYLAIDGKETSYAEILENLQQILFSMQAELAGAEVSTQQAHIEYLEKVIEAVEKDLPPITSFLIPGGTEEGAYLDVTRTVARRAERLAVAVKDNAEGIVSDTSIQFLNRLSSVLYALARHANREKGITENKPLYK